ncbi:hypothetical protein tinsulaeT_09270 [Thalassotalea insulae]|uniref:Prepilin-type N-terminal cleavage/methylation domain-containing protein n=1 Tax=Thalassotalea insulae TaxID=2056778 RepID=A0ABQ6GQ95_9GAMM|nr:prepilin-type N-terminal cleavage/methylation domain-containing protein [Thalassotalea insulae]GLX77587.1 hypothetical protein tinsulaeT_09270 [Thalassotalea insulae]
MIKNQGFSLLEVLIASTIFASVLVVASSAFKFFVSTEQRPLNSESVMKQAMEIIKVRNSIKGLQHYYLKNKYEDLALPKLFFLGENNGFTGISREAMNFPSQPTRISVSIVRNNENKTSLSYCEFDNKTYYPELEIESSCENPLLIAQNIKQAKFSYFGWSSLQSLYGNSAYSPLLEREKEWSPVWDARERGVLPQYIKVELEYEIITDSYQPLQLWFHISDADPVSYSVNNRNE